MGGSAGQQNKVANMGMDMRERGFKGVSAQVGAGCCNSASKKEKALTSPSILKRRSVNLPHRNKGKC